ncbi:hypothetical protein PIB30_050188 [Stylosanthes scabra]|uniref:Secreted protein n=1 Tax=Stylosanthes scabra TaxID=79078 RepID=A0ABU6THD3_9FABA|nr:hypothetical protein [Stylosanthes scabra]
MVKPERRVGLPPVVLLAYLLGFWRFIRTENLWVENSHSVYFRLFRCRFELGKLAKHPSGVWFSFSDRRTGRVIGTGCKVGRLFELENLHVPSTNLCALSFFYSSPVASPSVS